jgi:chromate reductase
MHDLFDPGASEIMSTLDIVGLCGSLRKASFNRAALRLAGELMPAGMQFEALDWHEVPVFNADVYGQGLPPVVAALRERVRRADGVLIVTPEYNFSVPGGLKNLLDWLSRGDDQPFALKPVAILSASAGPLGGARVQYDLRKVMLFMNAAVLAKPEVFIGMAASKFDAEGRCTDETTRKFVTDQMAAFQRWIAGVGRLRAG